MRITLAILLLGCFFGQGADPKPAAELSGLKTAGSAKVAVSELNPKRLDELEVLNGKAEIVTYRGGTRFISFPRRTIREGMIRCLRFSVAPPSRME
jgi:hypothetical protein